MRLSELIERRKRAKKKLENLSSTPNMFHQTVKQASLNSIQSYEKQILEFGSGLPIFHVQYTKTTEAFSDTRKKKRYATSVTYTEYIQAENEKEIELLFECLLPQAVYHIIETIHLRKPEKIDSEPIIEI